MKKYIHYTIAIISMLFLIRCEKDENPELLKTVFTNKVPELTTVVLSEITDTSAVSGGVIINAGGLKITANGVCWSISPNPTINDTKTMDSIGKMSFNSKLLGLKPFTTYYLRAYAINNIGIAYGNEVSLSTFGLPSVLTYPLNAITANTAVSGGNITTDGVTTIIAKGVCWSISPKPTIVDNKTINGSGIGSFTSNITNLKPVTTYYIRAYASNSFGTAYGNEINFTTLAFTITDYDENIYDTIHIGTQIWLKQNLKTTHYKNGAAITYTGTDSTTWQYNTTGAYAWFNNDEATYKETYGALYNWYTVNTGNLCPTGWHVPSDVEWTTLTNYLGGESVAGGKLKATTLWNSPNTGASNESGFTAFPGGYRISNGSYSNVGYASYWWSSNEVSSAFAWDRGLSYVSTNAYRSSDDKNYGFSVRCIKD